MCSICTHTHLNSHPTTRKTSPDDVPGLHHRTSLYTRYSSRRRRRRADATTSEIGAKLFSSLQHFLAPCGCSSSQGEMNAQRIPQEANSRRHLGDGPHVRRPIDTPFLGRVFCFCGGAERRGKNWLKRRVPACTRIHKRHMRPPTCGTCGRRQGCHRRCLRGRQRPACRRVPGPGGPPAPAHALPGVLPAAAWPRARAERNDASNKHCNAIYETRP